MRLSTWLFIAIFLSSFGFTQVLDYGVDNQGLVAGTDPFFDPQFDYSEFPGRVTDRNREKTIFKVSSENKNVRFFKPGDKLSFTVKDMMRFQNVKCKAYIRSVEDGFFVMYAQDTGMCFKSDFLFRRGTQVNFFSEVLAKRVYEASVYRKSLLKRRIDFMRQLNEINNYLWSFDERKAITAADFDKKIIQLQKEKEQALDKMIIGKKDKVRLQKKLIDELNRLDEDIKFYRPTRHELLTDRWNMGYDLGLPLGRRPQKIKQKDINPNKKTSRWHLNKNFR